MQASWVKGDPLQCLQNFQRAVEEGKEVLERRAGRTPATDHAAWDALDPDDERNQVRAGVIDFPAGRHCRRSRPGESSM